MDFCGHLFPGDVWRDCKYESRGGGRGEKANMNIAYYQPRAPPPPLSLVCVCVCGIEGLRARRWFLNVKSGSSASILALAEEAKQGGRDDDDDDARVVRDSTVTRRDFTFSASFFWKILGAYGKRCKVEMSSALFCAKNSRRMGDFHTTAGKRRPRRDEGGFAAPPPPPAPPTGLLSFSFFLATYFFMPAPSSRSNPRGR